MVCGHAVVVLETFEPMCHFACIDVGAVRHQIEERIWYILFEVFVWAHGMSVINQMILKGSIDDCGEWPMAPLKSHASWLLSSAHDHLPLCSL